MEDCEACGDKRYRIATRDDGKVAVERCDTCAYFGDNDPRTLWDVDAAKLARRDGVLCDETYPCFVHAEPR